MKYYIILLALILMTTFSYAQVGIGTTNPQASAKLDVSSTDKGFLPPRMSTTDRNAIAGPTAGLVIYNMTTNTLQFSDGTNWVDLVDESTTAITGTEPTSGNGDVGIGTNTPNVNAILDVESTTRGFLPPRMTTTERDNISNPAEGLTIFNITEGCLEYYSSVRWVSLCNNLYSPLAVFCSGPTEVKDVVGAGGDTWMDRNLGASHVANSSADTDAYGDLYQWGRATEGHQCRTSGETIINATTATPGTGSNAWDGLFITEDTSPFDWLDSQDDNLWQGLNGVNNPCPAGYRLPTEAELDNERSNWTSQDAAGAFASPLKLPVASYRKDSGEVLTVGSIGSYWSSSVTLEFSDYIQFDGSSVSIFNSRRAFGRSVRCIKD